MDKDNSIAIIDRNNCLEKMRNILSDSSKFTHVSVDKQLNFIFNVEKHITGLLKDLKKSKVISETVYKSLKPRGLEFFMDFVKVTNSWLITVHLLDRLCQQSKHLHII